MIKRYCFSFFILLLICDDIYADQENDDQFKVQLIALWTDSLEISLNWYVHELGFEVEKEIQVYPDYQLRMAFVNRGDFHLELLEKKPSYRPSQFLKEGQSLGGMIKLGFVVNDLDSLYQLLQLNGKVDFATEIGDLPETNLEMDWPKRYFLIRDPDGNYIQFFSYDDQIKAKMHAWLAMVVVQNIDQSFHWYEKQFGFKKYAEVGEPGNRRTIVIRNDFVLELFEPSVVIPREQVPQDSTLLGFTKIAFGTSRFESLHQSLIQNKATFAIEPEESAFEWASQSMIVKDHEGNWIQLFEIEK